MPSYKSDKLKIVEEQIGINTATDDDLEEFTLPESIEPSFSE
jgi:hypothetical protein